MFTHFSVTGCSLELLKLGEKGFVTFCKSQNKIILNKLISIGIVPGSIITLEQNFPSFLIKIENTFLALDTENIRAIYIRIIDD